MTRAPVLYVIVCGSPVAHNVGKLVSLAQEGGWDVCVICTPDGRKFIDPAALARQTGHPVRSAYKNPGDPDVLPDADAMIVAPATVNTVNKLGAGIADTLALGLLVEGYGKGIPIVLLPYTNDAMATYPVFAETIDKLRSWGFRVLFGPDVVDLHAPGAGTAEDRQDAFPWHLALEALADLRAPGGATS
jgi:phosphopantothenoylcysteine synthetase/decarboxylase